MKKRNANYLVAVFLFSFLLITAITFSLLPNTIFQKETETGVTAENVIDDVSIRRNGFSQPLLSDL